MPRNEKQLGNISPVGTDDDFMQDSACTGPDFQYADPTRTVSFAFSGLSGFRVTTWKRRDPHIPHLRLSSSNPSKLVPAEKQPGNTPRHPPSGHVS